VTCVPSGAGVLTDTTAGAVTYAGETAAARSVDGAAVDFMIGGEPLLVVRDVRLITGGALCSGADGAFDRLLGGTSASGLTTGIAFPSVSRVTSPVTLFSLSRRPFSSCRSSYLASWAPCGAKRSQAHAMTKGDRMTNRNPTRRASVRSMVDLFAYRWIDVRGTG
jgi:hypothetical protein